MTTSDASPRLVFIDALNVAYWCGMPPSLRLPLTLMRALLASGDQALLYFDASARHALKHEVDVYQQLLQYPQHCIEVPAGRTADGVMLRYARIRGACIVSRDRYRDYRSRFRKLIDDPTRLLPGYVADDQLQVSGLALAAPLAATAELAWQQLRPLIIGASTMQPAHFSSDSEIEHIAACFLDRSLPSEAWTHAAHFSAAFVLLRDPARDTLREMPALIRAYNEACGKHNTDSSGYHDTITLASLRAAQAWLAARPGMPLFESLNSLLASPYGKSDWLLTHWSRERLFSVEARRSWLEPDLLALPF